VVLLGRGPQPPRVSERVALQPQLLQRRQPQRRLRQDAQPVAVPERRPMSRTWAMFSAASERCWAVAVIRTNALCCSVSGPYPSRCWSLYCVAHGSSYERCRGGWGLMRAGAHRLKARSEVRPLHSTGMTSSWLSATDSCSSACAPRRVPCIKLRLNALSLRSRRVFRVLAPSPARAHRRCQFRGNS